MKENVSFYELSRLTSLRWLPPNIKIANKIGHWLAPSQIQITNKIGHWRFSLCLPLSRNLKLIKIKSHLGRYAEWITLGGVEI